MLSAAVDRYLSARRAVGFQLRDTEEILRNFAAFASAKPDTHIRRTTVVEWIRSRNSSWRRDDLRLRTVILLARFLHAEDDRHEIPPAPPCRRESRRRPPFLFTPAHVGSLVGAARALEPVHSLRPHVYSTLFGLLASTGMRISEALNLRLEDLTSAGVFVRNTKFGKNRLLALHPTTKHQIDGYLRRRIREASTCPFFFISIHGNKLDVTAVRWTFQRLVYSLGIARPEDELRPRLHDLRFYFVNQALSHSANEHEGIGRHMLALTTYLGHRDVRNGYWYMEATPALFSKIAARCEAVANGASA